VEQIPVGDSSFLSFAVPKKTASKKGQTKKPSKKSSK
jgi:hypothetical protein